MAVLALVVYGVWLVIAFGVRTVLQLRRTGDSGWRGMSGRPGTVEWFAGVLFTIALFVGVAGPVADLTLIDPLVRSDRLRVAGFAVAVFGVVATVVAQWSMRDSWRIGVDRSETTELRLTGLFARVRNPIFSAMVVTAAGLAAMVPNVVSIVGVAMLVVTVQLQVRCVEEPYLQAVHGEPYTFYTGSVGRFVPRRFTRSPEHQT